MTSEWPECPPESGESWEREAHSRCIDERVELTPAFVAEVIEPRDPDFEMDLPDAPVGVVNSTLRTCQVFWLANLPREFLRGVTDGNAIIRYLVKHGFEARVPLDTKQWAMGTRTALKGAG